MRILGIGTDIIDIERIKKAGEKNPRFLQRILTEAEINYCFTEGSKYLSVAARFAAKEAVVKALGTGFSNCSFLDIEIINNKDGKPEVILKNNALTRYDEMKGKEISVSMSHDRNASIAFVVIQG